MGVMGGIRALHRESDYLHWDKGELGCIGVGGSLCNICAAHADGCLLRVL